MSANRLRGECAIQIGDRHLVLRPSYAGLVAAEEELGSLIGMIERASEARLTLREISVLFDHLLRSAGTIIDREVIGQSLIEQGLSNVTPVLRTLFEQILRGVE